MMKNYFTQPFADPVSTFNTRNDFRKDKETEKQLRLKKELAEFGTSSKPSFNYKKKDVGFYILIYKIKVKSSIAFVTKITNNKI